MRSEDGHPALRGREESLRRWRSVKRCRASDGLLVVELFEFLVKGLCRRLVGNAEVFEHGAPPLLGLLISALTYVGAAAALWASADESVNFWKLSVAQVANTFAATTTPAGVGGLALSTRYLQKGGGLSAMRATTAVASREVITMSPVTAIP